MTKSPSPPPVKPAFYKNPSKAIEKGGGFFIPGLRGPRLRYLVSILAACLLGLNHVMSRSEHPHTQTVSELFTAFSSLAVFATAVMDSAAQAAAQAAAQSPESDGPILPIREDSAIASVEQKLSSSSQKEPNSAETAAWALAVCTDLTPATHIAVFRSGKLVMATPNVDVSKPDGPVVQRVYQESLPFYVSNTNDLPADITLPFLSGGAHSVFAVPALDCVVSFSAEISSSKPAGFSVEERRWLRVFAPRIVDGVTAS